MNRLVAILFGIIVLLGCIIPSRAGVQEIDPFYLQRLTSGEQAFLEGDYETAIEELKIAIIGFQGEEILKAKAYLYLGMSYYHLKNENEAEKKLKGAKNILGMEGLRSIISDESVWFYLNRVLLELRLLDPAQKPQAKTATPLISPEQKRSASTNERTTTRDLEQRIRSNPRNVNLYYDLYEHHMENANRGAAKKTMENLIRKNPDEARGFYFLGRIQYQQRELKDSEKSLGKVFELQEKVPIEEYVLLEAKIYHILTMLLRGERQRAYRMYAQWAERLSEDKIRFLDLDEQDRGIFLGFVDSWGARAEIERLRIQGENPKEEAVPEQKRRAEQSGEQGAGLGGSAAKETEVKVDPVADLNVENVVPLDQVDTPPVLRERVDPEYPASAANRKIEGFVIVNALISETGNVMDVVVVQGLAGGFNEKTVEAVRQWKYEPAVKDGQKVKVWKRITITFKTR